MRKYITSAAAFLIAVFSANAQNINAQVQVTNSYSSSVGDFAKQNVPVNVPDSALKFDYDFDYSVFDSPYRGAYEFVPYTVRVVPEAQPYDGRVLYLNAGAGYSLYPVFQAVFSPKMKGNFAMSVHQDLQGYYGDYWDVAAESMKIIRGSLHKGYDLAEKFGVEGSLNAGSLLVSLNADYKGLYNDDGLLPSLYHSGVLKAGIKSTPGMSSYFLYDVVLSAEIGADRLDHRFEPIDVMQQSFGLDATIGSVLKGKYRILVDVDARHDIYSGISVQNSTFVQAFPRIDLLLGMFSVNAGAKLSYAGKSFRIHPDVEMNLSLLDGGLDVFAGLTGGQKLNSYNGFKDEYHRFNISYTDKVNAVTERKFDAYAGFKGHIGSHFQYNLKGGYAVYGNAPLASVVREPSFSSTVTFLDYNMVYADASLSWKSERVEVLAGANFRKTSLPASEDYFDLPMFSGDISAVYNIRKRIYIGVSCDGATARGLIPAFADLGAFAEYRISDRFSVWAKGGNLLNMTIQRLPRYVEKGINFTGGITLNL